MKRLLTPALCAAMIFLLVACGSGKAATMDSAENGYAQSPSYDESVGWDDSASLPSGGSKALHETTKMIYTADLDLETLDFDKAMEDVTALVDQFSGYFEDQTVASYGSGYRYARLTIRIPSADFNDFYTQLGQVCHTVRRNSSQQNISEAYYDVESRLNTAKTKLARLQELLAQAENMADIITIEDAIADTEQTIDSLSGTLRSYDSLVDYATITVELDEVYRLSGTGDAPLTLGQRLGSAFVNGMKSVGEFFEGLLVWLAYSWLWLILLAAVAYVCITLIRRRKRKKVQG